MDANDRDLAQRASSGDRDAFAALYERHLDAVYRYAFYRVRDDAEADDVTSEVFHRALQAMPRYEPRRPFLAFLYTIARNVIADRFRRARHTVPLDEAADARSEERPLDERAGELDDARKLRVALAQLTPLQQEVIVLRFVEGWSLEEIASIQGKPASTVRGIQFRALAALREILGRKTA
jgi:RNA polymerase sigma-70 factor (ECF subfamily)